MTRAEARIRLLAPFDPLYGSYWIDGLRCIGTIQLYPLPAQLLPSSIAFEFADRKFVIDAWDKPIVNEWWWKWSDVYGKVNLSLDTKISKVVPMGPGSPPRPGASSPWPRPYYAAPRWGKEMSRLDYAGGFLRQWYKRLPLTALTPGPSDPSYIFALHHYWPSEPDVNELRARFMRVTKASDNCTSKVASSARTTIRCWDRRLAPPSPLVPSMVAADPEFGGRAQHPGRERVFGVEAR